MAVALLGRLQLNRQCQAAGFHSHLACSAHLKASRSVASKWHSDRVKRKAKGVGVVKGFVPVHITFTSSVQ